MKKPFLSKPEICAIFGCTMAQLNTQYAANAKILGDMKDKAIRTGKKQGGATAEQLAIDELRYLELSK